MSNTTTRLRPAAFLLAAAFALTAAAGCAAAASPASTSANLLVCQHYEVQRAWVFAQSEPTVADAVKFIGWLGVDAGQSTGQLHADLNAMLAADAAGKSPGPASSRVLGDCQALGVKFSPAA